MIHADEDLRDYSGETAMCAGETSIAASGCKNAGFPKEESGYIFEELTM
jgi:hypothetical protein